MTRDHVTIRDVAECAEVSVSTVSLALNHPGRVSDNTRQRVLRVIDDLGFVPKAEAVARARRNVGRIGVLGPFSAHPAAGRRLNGILRAAAGADLEVVVFDHDSSADSVEPFVTNLPRSGRLDGLLIISLPPQDELVDKLLEARLPATLVDGYDRRLSSVQTDDVMGGRRAAEHVLGLARAEFAFLGESQRSQRYVSPAQRRLAGYQQALQTAGRDVTSLLWTAREFTAAYAEAARLLSTLHLPAAVFASDDMLAAAVLRAAHHRGLRTPEDVAVVGFDDSDVARVLDLTTVRQPLEESGSIALRLLLEHIRGSAPIQATTLELQLIRRGSA